MKKLKISIITLLVLFGIFGMFLNIIPMWLGLSMTVIALCMFVLLNIEVFKLKGLIKKLVVYADIALGLSVALCLVPLDSNLYLASHYTVDLLLLVIAGLLVAILVNAYKE
jgi:hypothetical protein